MAKKAGDLSRKRKRGLSAPVEDFVEEVNSEPTTIVWEKLPEKSLRVKGKVYATKQGVLKKWNGNHLVPVCRDCPGDDKKGANYPDKDGKENQLCGPCAHRAGLYSNNNY